MADGSDAERDALMRFESKSPTPQTITKIVQRVRALILELIPVEVESESLISPTSRTITPAVVHAFGKAAGDFEEALPFCLLRARQTFWYDANRSPADYDENMGRAAACEALARRIVHLVSPERLNSIMSKRYRYAGWDGEPSSANSALETAIDQHCTVFLSSNESQHVVDSLWNGEWVQKNNSEYNVEYVPYSAYGQKDFWNALDTSRLAVPRYQNWTRVFLWLFFLFVYSQTVQQPLDRLDPHYHFDVWEVLLYGMALAFSFEELTKMYKTARYYTWKVLSFWVTVSLIIEGLLIAAFSYRMGGIYYPNDDDRSRLYQLRSFQLLSCVAPLIWMKLLTVFDGFKYIGTLQICVSRMLQESSIFFALLAIIAVGFIQAMFALDVADGSNDQTGADIINLLSQALLGSPNFDMSVAGASKFGLVLFYAWNVITSIILLNILISLFSSAYADVTDDAEAEFMTFFAHKTIDMIRAPDEFVYPAPFNLIEIFLVAPWEWVLPPDRYAQLNRVVMSVVFFVPLCGIALFESQINLKKNRLIKSLFTPSPDDDDIDKDKDPVCDDPEGQISRVPFSEIVKTFPNIAQSSEESIVHEIRQVKKQLDELMARLDSMAKEKEKGK